MLKQRSPLGILWAAITLIAAVYVAVRFFTADLTRTDYALMAFVHLSLAAQVLALVWNARKDNTAPPLAPEANRESVFTEDV